MTAITNAIERIEEKYLNDKTKLITGTGMISLVVGILHILYEEAERESPCETEWKKSFNEKIEYERLHKKYGGT